MSDQVRPCTVCHKAREKECSHVDCPNRRQVTAQPVGSVQILPSIGGESRGSIMVRRPHLFDD